MNRISDLQSLSDVLRGVVESLPTIQHFEVLSNGEDAVGEIEAFFNARYDGPVAFFQVAELPLDRTNASNPKLTFLCSLTVAVRPDDETANTKLQARNQALGLMMQLIGQLDTLAEEYHERGFRLSVGEQLYPVGRLANVSLQGYYTDVDVSIAANQLLYPHD